MHNIVQSGLVLLSLTAIGAAAADEMKTTPASQQFQTLSKTHQQAQDEFSKAYLAAKTDDERLRIEKELGRKSRADYYAGDLLSLINEYPKDPAALDAFRWLQSRLPYSKETNRAVDILLREWIEDERLAGVCNSLQYRSSPAGDKLLRAAIEKSPHRAVQGYARFSLAVSLKRTIDLMADSKPAEREPLERDADQLLQQVIDKYSDLKQITTLGKLAESLQFELKHLGIGKTPPDIEGTDLDGKKMKLTDFRGKVTLVVFWGSWCGPCMADVPHEQALLKRYEDKPFVIVGVDSDKDPETGRKAGAKAGITWQSFWDGPAGGPITGKWNVTGWPTLYLLDGDGVIRFKGERLRQISVRKNKDGNFEQVHFLDEAVEGLVKEAAAKKP